MNRTRSRLGSLLRRDDQVGDEDADQREDDAVEHRVLHDEAGRGHRHRGGIAQALKRGGAEERGGPERAPARRIVDQEPDRDDGGPDEAGDDTFAHVAGIGGHGPPSLSDRCRLCAPCTSARTTNRTARQPGAAGPCARLHDRRARASGQERPRGQARARAAGLGAAEARPRQRRIAARPRAPAPPTLGGRGPRRAESIETLRKQHARIEAQLLGGLGAPRAKRLGAPRTAAGTAGAASPADGQLARARPRPADGLEGGGAGPPHHLGVHPGTAIISSSVRGRRGRQQDERSRGPAP